MITPELVREELNKLTLILNTRIEKTKDKLNSKRKLAMDLEDIGFIKISNSKYTLDIRNHGLSYISFSVTFRGKAVDIHEDHLVLRNRKEVPVSEFGESFLLSSVRYNRAVEEIYKRVISLSGELMQEDEDE
jgi:hypothetical protein